MCSQEKEKTERRIAEAEYAQRDRKYNWPEGLSILSSVKLNTKSAIDLYLPVHVVQCTCTNAPALYKVQPFDWTWKLKPASYYTYCTLYTVQYTCLLFRFLCICTTLHMMFKVSNFTCMRPTRCCDTIEPASVFIWVNLSCYLWYLVSEGDLCSCEKTGSAFDFTCIFGSLQ